MINMRIKRLKTNISYRKQVAFRWLQGNLAYTIAKIRGNGICSYWGFRNFGDLITPILLRKIGYTPINSMSANSSEFLFVGSILDSIDNSYQGIILGSGFLSNRKQKELVKAKVLGVRGQFSKRLTGVKYDVQLGDGGLILPKFFKSRPEKKYKLGIVPHYADQKDIRIDDWTRRFGNEAKIINVLQSPENVFNEICGCEYIFSSSLHGLVVADSLGISNLWMVLSDLCGNGEFKFHDYYSAFGETRQPYFPSGEESLNDLIKRMHKPADSVPDAIEKIHTLFLSIPDLIKH